MAGKSKSYTFSTLWIENHIYYQWVVVASYVVHIEPKEVTESVWHEYSAKPGVQHSVHITYTKKLLLIIN